MPVIWLTFKFEIMFVICKSNRVDKTILPFKLSSNNTAYLSTRHLPNLFIWFSIIYIFDSSAELAFNDNLLFFLLKIYP